MWRKKKKRKKYDFPVHDCHQEPNCSPNFSFLVRQCKWPFLSRKIVEIQKFFDHVKGEITPPLSIVIYLSFFISLFAFSRLFYNFRLTSKRTYSWSSSNYTIRCHLKKLTRNHTHSTLQGKSKNIENCIYILAKLDVKISRIDNTDQSCCL